MNQPNADLLAMTEPPPRPGRNYTLLFPILPGELGGVRGPSTLLMRMAEDHPVRGLRGLWNGYGGKVEEGETFFQAARREAREELPWISETDWNFAGRFGSWPGIGTDPWEVAVYFLVLPGAYRMRVPRDGAVCELSRPPHGVVPNLKWILPLVDAACRRAPFHVQGFHVIEGMD